MLGLATADQIGRYGVEAKYDAFLRENGDMAVTNLENHLRALSPDFSLDIPSPVGRDLVLTIDRRIQAIVEDELKFAVDYYGATGGTIDWTKTMRLLRSKNDQYPLLLELRARKPCCRTRRRHCCFAAANGRDFGHGLCTRLLAQYVL